MKRPISLPRSEGEVSRQAHADLPAGTYERELGREGFYGPATHLYHAHPPTAWSRFEGPLRPRAFDLGRIEAPAGCPWQARAILHNAHLRLRFWAGAGSMDHLVRNADGDELVFVHEGTGDLFCDFGRLRFEAGDYLLLPRGTLWRVESGGSFRMLLIEASGASFGLPDRGPLGDHAIFDPAVLDTPRMDDAFRAQQGETPWRIAVKARQRFSTIEYPFNPLDAVGWKGSLAPVRLNWRDIRPVVSSRYHLPPSVHTTFVAERFVVCTFCPRPLESDPGALNLPFFHSNVDYDEVLFFHRGKFMSRDDAGPGMLTFHPCGFSHGPHPGALEAAMRRERSSTDEVAVMLDARDALEPDAELGDVELADYADSWRSA